MAREMGRRDKGEKKIKKKPKMSIKEKRRSKKEKEIEQIGGLI